MDKEQIDKEIKDLFRLLDTSTLDHIDEHYHYWDLRVKVMALDRLNVIAAKLEDILK